MNPSKNNESASFPRQCGLCGRPLEGNGNGNHGTHPTCCSNCSRVERSFQGLGLGLGLDPLELPEAPGTSQTQGLGQRENVRQNAGSSVPAGYLLEAPPAEEENPDVNSSESPLSEVSDSELLKGSPWAGGIGQRDETKLPSEEPSSSSGSDIPFSRPSGPKVR